VKCTPLLLITAFTVMITVSHAGISDLITGSKKASVASPTVSANWMTDYAAALALAAKENKKILLDFTGSDWCEWCIRLKKDVFDTAEFKQFAGENLVLVEIDRPLRKSLPAEVEKQNLSLFDQYHVEQLPTIILLSPEGKTLKRESIFMNGPKGFIEWVSSK
jgi:thioredoxin-related protein